MTSVLKNKEIMKVSTAHDLTNLDKNMNVKMVGIVTLRQRPGTANEVITLIFRRRNKY